MSKGSARRKGEGYEDGWSRIFERNLADLNARGPLNSKLKCTEPFCQCEPGKCERKDDKEDKE